MSRYDRPIRDDEGPNGGLRRWGLAVVIGVEEIIHNGDGWIGRTKYRLRDVCEAEDFRHFNDAELNHLMKTILAAYRGWRP